MGRDGTDGTKRDGTRRSGAERHVVESLSEWPTDEEERRGTRRIAHN